MRGKRTSIFNVDLGLALLGVLNQPREPLTQVEIAAYCGCSRQRIEQIEKQALRKLRHRLRYGSKDSQLWVEVMDEMFNRRSAATPAEKRVV